MCAMRVKRNMWIRGSYLPLVRAIASRVEMPAVLAGRRQLILTFVDGSEVRLTLEVVRLRR